ncbi:NAD(P)-binding domain-containing protein [Peribacillus muralis]|uniref:2-hydroxyacid dehydrogenase n=1 Tax=Peribacillus muralis TaxID=264697 RepID=UPI001F4E25E1|nr:NAD(P)-dependent oxidoreductase [Peribacillus muralis]MCK1992957.1 NAD(P)-binding domain-containing protein [Peribacillus muralis]MCK2013512.1 NAD(P)-binding domain-containing protein [Peribacillus muralis]
MGEYQRSSRILIASNTFETEEGAYDVFRELDCEVVTVPAKERKHWTEDDLAKALQGIDGAILGGDHPVTERVLETADKLKIISLNCTGYDHLDVNAAIARGIAVCNMPGLSYNAVADFIWGQIFAVMRQIVKGDRAIRSGQWVKGVEKSASVSEKTIGIIGMGSIGQAVAKRAMGFDMKILACVRTERQELVDRYNVTFVSKEELLSTADIVVICCPLSTETHQMIGESELKSMKHSSYIINSSRGEIINEEALYEALVESRIAGAALDVFKEEPLMESKFFKLENVVITPHIGGLADRQIFDCAEGAARNLVSFLSGEKPLYIINPDVCKVKTKQ